MTMTDVRQYTSREVCERSGLTYRQLNYGCIHGLFYPDRTQDPEPGWLDHQGSGYPRAWPEREVVKAVALAQMLAAGISWPKAAELLAEGLTATLTVSRLPETLP